MKKNLAILLMVVLCGSNVYALDKNEFNQAMSSYNNKDYNSSYKLFNKLFLKNLDNIEVNYYLAKSASKLKKYNIAVSAYERILILKPNSPKIRLELANSYMQMAVWSQALIELNRVLESKLPKQIEEKVNSTIEILKNKEKTAIHNIYALLGIMYDSNINNISDISSFSIYSPSTDSTFEVNQNSEKESSTIYQFLGIYNNKYKIDTNFILDSTVNIFNQKYINHKEKDIHLLSLSTKPTYFSKAYKTSLAFTFDKFYLGHEKYQQNYYIKPEYTRSLNKLTLFSTALNLGSVNYEKLVNRDYKTVNFQNSLRYISRRFGLFKLDLNLGRDFESDDVRTDVDKKYFESALSNSIKVFTDYNLSSKLSYKQTNYSDKDVNFLSNREDNRTTLSLSLQKELTKNVTLSFGYSYIENKSNHEPSSYDKYILKSNLFIKF